MTEKNPLIRQIEQSKDDIRCAVKELLMDVMKKAGVLPSDPRAVDRLHEKTFEFVENEVVP